VTLVSRPAMITAPAYPGGVSHEQKTMIT
jgi:hypothetical protein